MSYPDIYYMNLVILIYLSNLFFELTLFIWEIQKKENIYMGFFKLFII